MKAQDREKPHPLKTRKNNQRLANQKQKKKGG